MVYTKHAPRRQQFHVARAMQQPQNAISTPLPSWIIKKERKKKKEKKEYALRKGYSHSFGITYAKCAVSLLDSREQRYIKAMTITTTTTAAAAAAAATNSVSE